MKVRTGFVSNSSSASFVATAIPLTGELETKLEEEYGEEYWEEFFVPNEWDYEGTSWIGTSIMISDDNESGKLELNHVKDIWYEDKNLRKLLELAEKTQDDIKLIYGTMAY
jgi:hypothetical protein